MSGFFARPGIDLGDVDLRTFTGKQDCGSAAEASGYFQICDREGETVAKARRQGGLHHWRR
jgi:hypothetical protein